MLHKSFKFDVKELDEETGIFEGYAATFSNVPDSYGDIIDKGAFKKSLNETGNRVKILWNHSTMEPIGIPLEMSEDSKGLYFKGKLSLGVQRAKEVLSLMKDGVINEMSIGYDTITEKMDGTIRHLKEIKLWDISPVTFAANPEAVITGVKCDFEELLKSGRVLSAQNKDKIRAALAALQALLDSAGEDEPEKSTPVSTDKEAAEEIIETIDWPEFDEALVSLKAFNYGFDLKKAESQIDALILQIGGK
jgi:hypothetical protein